MANAWWIIILSASTLTAILVVTRRYGRHRE
jgi:hypothetical protein